MDVFEEIKEAEKRAESIESGFRLKADALLSAIPLDLQKEKDRREGELRSEMDALRAESLVSREKGKAAFIAQTAAESAMLEEKARANGPKAVETLLEMIGL